MAYARAQMLEHTHCEWARNGAREKHERLRPHGQNAAIRSAEIGTCHKRQTEARQQRLMRSAKVGTDKAAESGEHGRFTA
jgi:hypothetical protein